MPVRIKIRHPGELGKGHFSLPSEERHRVDLSLAHKVGEKSVLGMHAAIATFNKRHNPRLSEEAKEDEHFLAKHFRKR